MSRNRGKGRTQATRSPQIRPTDAEQSPRSLQITHYERSGPLPSPEELRQYNDIVPNGAERIFQRWEKQSDHRIAMEAKSITSDIWRGWVGFVGSFILDSLFLLVSWDLVRKGHDAGGAALAITATIHLSIGGVSLYTVRQRANNRRQRVEELDNQRGR